MSIIVRADLENLERCDSPIERELYLALLLTFVEREPLLWKSTWALVTQHPIEVGDQTYRADIVVRVSPEATNRVWSFVVECDGHDFHERTKEQAEHDRSRDRAMTALGYVVLRFTGREIHRDAMVCAREAVDTMIATVEREMGEVAA